MSVDPRSTPPLHPQRAVDRRQPGVRLPHAVPPAQAAPGPHQGERGGGSSRRPRHDARQRHGRRVGRTEQRAGREGEGFILLFLVTENGMYMSTVGHKFVFKVS